VKYTEDHMPDAGEGERDRSSTRRLPGIARAGDGRAEDAGAAGAVGRQLPVSCRGAGSALIEVNRYGGFVTVALAGDFDRANPGLIWTTLVRLDAGPVVVVDDARLRFISSTGVQELVAGLAMLQGRGIDIRLTGWSYLLRRQLDLMFPHVSVALLGPARAPR
jgi:anti-anti-sigma regulatory factor